MELRCKNKLHGILVEDFIEIRCNSRFCGAGGGVIVLHRFAIGSGRLVETKRYRDPLYGRSNGDASRSVISVRDQGHSDHSDQS